MPEFRELVRYDQRRPVNLRGLEDVIRRADQAGVPIVMVHRGALKEMYCHARDNPHSEIGGYLLGFPAIDGETGVFVTYVARAVHGTYDSSPTHVKIHGLTFGDVEHIRKQENLILVGWYHSHPGLGIFFSGVDTNTHKNFHSEDYQVGFVIDPSKADSDSLGVFAWDKSKELVRLPTESICLVDAPPEPRIEPSEGVEVSEALAHLRQAIWKRRDKFNPNLPVIILSKPLRERLLDDSSTTPEGFLVGDFSQVAGYRFIAIDDIRPRTINRAYLRQRTTRRGLRPGDSLSAPRLALSSSVGTSPIGIYLSEERVNRLFKAGWMSCRRLSFQMIAKYCSSDYYAVILLRSEGGTRKLAPAAWTNWSGRLVELPPAHIIITN